MKRWKKKIAMIAAAALVFTSMGFFGVNAYAQEHIVMVRGKSFLNGKAKSVRSFPAIGESIVKPEITVISNDYGAGLYFNISDSSLDGWWERLKDGGNEHSYADWEKKISGEFTKGSWRFVSQIRIDDNSLAVFDEGLMVTVDGESWVVNETSNSFAWVRSPIYKAKEQIKTVTGQSYVNAQETKLRDIPKNGGNIIAPTIITLEPASVGIHFESLYPEGYWCRLKDGKSGSEDGNWEPVESGKFTSGKWKFYCELWLSFDGSNDLADELSVKVDGEDWTVRSVSRIDDRTSFATLYSPVIAVGQPIYRLYNKKTKEHLWTSQKKEYDTLPGYGWTQEGEAWKAPYSGTGVYRLYNPKSKDHHYTSSQHEADVLTAQYGWKYDNNKKPVFYSGGDTPVYRLYNKSFKVGSHHFTKSKKEYDTLPGYGWKQEGVAFKCVQ